MIEIILSRKVSPMCGYLKVSPIYVSTTTRLAASSAALGEDGVSKKSLSAPLKAATRVSGLF
ncbi:MAG: hypothetical protein WCC17_09860 [Candidatus Nitrosopolaris sp.]